MKKKINIAELLKNCPKGMVLDCTMLDHVVFEKIDDSSYHHPIIIRRTDTNKTIHLTKYGQYSDEEDYKCIIFPKGKTNWDGFEPPCTFKDGDIVFSGVYLISILKEIKPTENLHCYVSIDMCGKLYIDEGGWTTQNIRFATEEEKQKLFDAIKANGYKWNEETNTLGKLIEPKFKVGDRIKSVISSSYYTVVDIKNDQYFIKSDTEKYPYQVPFSNEINYKLVPDKFDITTLKPFYQVLVRDNDEQQWSSSFFSHCAKSETYKYSCVNDMGWAQCIPYEGNEHLLGTTNDCDNFYKTWE